MTAARNVSVTELDERQLERIPRTDPAVVVANHPYGGLEGLHLIARLQQYRSDSIFQALGLLHPSMRTVMLTREEEIEPDGKGAPVLLRRYLKLGGRLACCNVDESFSGVIDGRIVVDLLRTEPKVLQKYMGREQAAAFISYTREQPRIPSDTHAVS